MGPKRNIYVIYASQNKALSHNILGRLQLLEKDFNVSIWQDTPIYPDQQWQPQNESRLQQADIVLLLVSNAFMHSQFVQQIEFKNVIDRYKEGRSTVIPVLLDNCPWDIDFNSDDYNFSLTELQVLPTNKKPISDWNVEDKALSHVIGQIRHVIAPVIENGDSVISDENPAGKRANAIQEEQIPIDFTAEKEGDSTAEQEKDRLREEAETKKRIEKERRLQEEEEAKRIALEERKLREEIEAKRRAEEGRKIREEAEAKRRSLEKKRLKEETEAKKREEAQARKRVAVENKEKEPANGLKLGTESKTMTKDGEQKKSTFLKKQVWVALVVAALAVLGIWAFSLFNSDSEEQAPTTPEIETTTIENPIDTEEPIAEDVEQEVSFSKLEVGDPHEGGLVFAIDQSGTSGKIAHSKDAGPMSWESAMNIHEQLGEGWRLPTLDELRLMYRTIGQGATNSGEFTDELYWSATPYDAYQARLLKFRNGNTSYHYNKAAEHRKFYVRAVRDF